MHKKFTSFLVPLLALSILSASAQSFSSPSSPLTLTKDTPVTVSSMSKGTAIYYSFPVPPNTRNLSITTTGTTGDADIYLNKDFVRNTKTSTWKSTKSASTESIILSSPSSGKYFLTLRAYTATTNTVVSLKYVDITTGITTILKGTPISLTPMTKGEDKYFTFTLPTSSTNLTLTTTGTQGDADIYLSKDTVPSNKTAAFKSTNDSSNERIAIATPASGVYYLLLRAFSATANTLLTLDYATPSSPTTSPTPVVTAPTTEGSAPVTSGGGGGSTPITTTPVVIVPVVNGSCSTSNGATLSSSPTTNLCSTGTASSVTNSSSYTWSCSGSNGGTTASCSAAKTAVVTTASGLSGSYYPNITLTGTPVLTRTEAVAFDWGQGSPASGIVGTDLYSVRWTGYVTIPTTGTYQFQTRSDDGVRLYINNALVIDNWTNHGDTADTSNGVTLTAGQSVPVVLEYFEQAGGALIHLMWRTPSTTSFITIPATSLTTGTVTIPTTPVVTTPTAAPGSCGSSNSQSFTAAPTTNLCSAGTSSTVAGTGPYTWSCTGTNGGGAASCSATRTVTVTPVNGSCGSSHNQTLSSLPTTNLCSAGTASSVTNSSSYTWSCTGSNGGTTASCSAAKPVVATPPTTGSIAATIMPSRVSGVAPLAVFFDSTQTTSSLTSRPFHELLYQWNFGDQVTGGSGSCIGGSPVPREAGQGSYCTGVITGNSNLDSKNYAEGPLAAHVFETPGTYTVTLTASQGDSNFNGVLDASEYARQTVTITVSDQNAVYANNTVCIANGVTPTAGTNGCPSGSYGVDASNASAINTALTTGCGGNGCKRVLLRRGDTFTLSSTIIIASAGPGIIGSYGSGSKPVVSSNGVTQFTYRASDWRFVDIRQDLQGTNNSAVGVFSDTANLTNVLLLRVDTYRGQGFKTAGSNLGSATSGIWDGIFLVDGTLKQPPATPANGLNGYYPTGFRVAVMGNHIDMDQGSEHGSRSYAQRIVISHNTVEDVASGRAAITNRSFGWGGDGGLPAGTNSGTAVISQNYDVGNGPGGTIGYGTTNQSIDGRPRDVIFERNISPRAIDSTALQYGTWRNNIIANNTSAGVSVASAQGMNPGIGQCPNHLYFYHNSAYSGATGSNSADIAQFVQLPPECTGLMATIQNNLVYAPNSTTDGVIMNLGGQVSETTCATCNTLGTGEKHTSPLYQVSPALLIQHFTPSSGSYANGRGITVPVWNDFFGNWQQAIRDIGAVIIP